MMSSSRLVDQEAYQTYSDYHGQEMVLTKRVPGTPGVVFDTWIEHVWSKHTIEDLSPGQGRGLLGNLRRITMGIQEEIVSVGEPVDGDDEVIPSVMYKMVKFGPNPFRDHIALVRFVPTESKNGEPHTTVTWSIKSVNTLVGNVLFCGGALARLQVRMVLTLMLKGLNPKTIAAQAEKTNRG